MSAESEKLADFSGHDSTSEKPEARKKGWKNLNKVSNVVACSKWGLKWSPLS